MFEFLQLLKTTHQTSSFNNLATNILNLYMLYIQLFTTFSDYNLNPLSDDYFNTQIINHAYLSVYQLPKVFCIYFIHCCIYQHFLALHFF